MLALCYTSSATTPFDDSDLAQLLMNSRATNRRLSLTGFLLHRDGHFLQFLEGDDEQVTDRFERIASDPRHTNVSIVLREKSSTRRFPEWSMGYETVTDSLADEIPGYRGLVSAPVAPGAAGSGVSVALRQLSVWFQTRVTDAA